MIVRPRLEQIVQRAPLFGDMGFDRRHRHLREAAGDEGREDHAEWRSVVVGSVTGDQETEVTANDLHPDRKAGIGRLEMEPVDALDVLRLFAESPGQDQKISRAATGVDAPPYTSCSPYGQRR